MNHIIGVFGCSESPTREALVLARAAASEICARDGILLAIGQHDGAVLTAGTEAMNFLLSVAPDYGIGRAVAIGSDGDCASLEAVSNDSAHALYVNASLPSPAQHFLSAVTSHALIALDGDLNTLAVVSHAASAGRPVVFLNSRQGLLDTYNERQAELRAMIGEGADTVVATEGGTVSVSEVEDAVRALLNSDKRDVDTPQAAVERAMELLSEDALDTTFAGYPEKPLGSPTRLELEFAWEKLENTPQSASLKYARNEGVGPDDNGSDKTAVAAANPKVELTKILLPRDEDEDGSKVENVYFTTRKYQVYLANNRIRYRLPDDFETASALRKNLYGFSDIIDDVQTMRGNDAFKGDKELAARTLARAMSQAFDSDPSGATELLKGLQERMSTSINSHLRMKFVIANAGTLLAIVVTLLALLCLLKFFESQPWFPFSVSVLELYTKLSILGAMGAFLSVSIGIRQLRVERDLRVLETVWTGAVRIVIGVMAAIIVGLALDAKVLSPGFGTDPVMPVYYLLALVAGFSESVVPNTLKLAKQTYYPEEGLKRGGNNDNARSASART